MTTVRRRARRPAVVTCGLAAAAVVAGATAAFMLTGHGDATGDDGPGRGTHAPPATTPVVKGDVVDTESVDGRLTYSGERTIAAPARGVVTWAPEEGATVTRGESLLRVNDEPVTLMYGSLPYYRTLRAGVSDGRDVEQLERNLKALGYGDGLTVDREFTSATTAAVLEWQDDRGLPETGVVDASQVVFEPAAVRIGDVKARAGQRVSPGGPALTVTGTRPIVHVDLDAAKQDLAVKGAKVTIELPDGEQVKGRITDVGRVAEPGGGSGSGSSGGAGGGSQEDGGSTVDVEIRLDRKKTGRLDQAPVSVDLQGDRSRDVLSVPVEALLALREGGFGVEAVESDGTVRIVPVEAGIFGGGRVEVTGSGLREGMKVGVPAS